MTITGCSECNCDPSGSIALTCAADTGVCTCRDQVTGDKCDQCAASKKHQLSLNIKKKKLNS